MIERKVTVAVHLPAHCSEVWRYSDYVHECEYVDDNVQHEERAAREVHLHRDWHSSVDSHWYRVNISHLILVTDRDQERNLDEQKSTLSDESTESLESIYSAGACVTCSATERIYLSDDLLESEERERSESCSRLAAENIWCHFSRCCQID